MVLVLPDQIPAELKKAEDRKTVVHMAGNVRFPENRQIGIQVYSRLTAWLRDGLIVVRPPPTTRSAYVWH